MLLLCHEYEQSASMKGHSSMNGKTIWYIYKFFFVKAGDGVVSLYVDERRPRPRPRGAMPGQARPDSYYVSNRRKFIPLWVHNERDSTAILNNFWLFLELKFNCNCIWYFGWCLAVARFIRFLSMLLTTRMARYACTWACETAMWDNFLMNSKRRNGNQFNWIQFN